MEINSRIGWIDDWKGFMLLIVCLGHYKAPIPYMVFFTSVHVASFFFLSGLLFDMNKNRAFGVFFRKKVFSLLIPYISLSLLFLPFEPLVYNVNLPLSVGPHYVLKEISNLSWLQNPKDGLTMLILHLEGIFIEGLSSEITGPLWFLWALFVVEMVLWVILRIASNRIWVVAMALLLMCVGWKFNDLQIYLPLNLNTITSAASISCLGHLCQPAVKYIQKVNVLYTAIAVMGLFSLYWAGLNFNQSPDLFNNSLGPNLFWYGITICCGLWLYMLVFNYIDQFYGGAKCIMQ